MQEFFRSVAIGLGILMGTFDAGVQPDLQVTLQRGTEAVLVSALVEQALGPKLEQVLDEGVSVALTFTASVEGGATLSSTQVLAYQPLNRVWTVTKGSEGPVGFATRNEAHLVWRLWKGTSLRLAGTGPYVVTTQVALSFPGRPDWKADLVWKPPVVVWKKTFGRLSEIPF